MAPVGWLLETDFQINPSLTRSLSLLSRFISFPFIFPLVFPVNWICYLNMTILSKSLLCTLVLSEFYLPLNLLDWSFSLRLTLHINHIILLSFLSMQYMFSILTGQVSFTHITTLHINTITESSKKKMDAHK